MNELALFNNFFDDLEDDYSIPAGSFRKAFQTPRVDVKEDKDAYTLQMDMPGKTEKDVNIELNRNVLTISSENETHEEKKNDKADKKDGTKWLLRERTISKFSRSFTLPEDVDSEKVSAAVKNGVLTVTMPRHPAKEPKRIAIQVA